ncbi:hypothetical protein [Streptomyces europaeiscabiei]|uniref:hypothetical protein n=1 Tax=Streptomyces europaeiscabiei TaxID=146819 RepID=UPI002E2AE579|nr:hypothetical protein [Streptomyces europaeiscabiei]
MGRISIDYDLMYELGRDIWALRDRLLDTSRAKPDFASSDIGPREQTWGALIYFHGAWKKSFEDGWQVMTDLGNLLDEMGKAFYDQDAQGAVSARQQEAAMVRQDIKQDNAAYQQKRDTRIKQAKAEDLRMRHAARQAIVDKQQAELDKKRAVVEKEQQALQQRQEALNKKYEALREKQEPLQKRQEELLREQQELWKEQNSERKSAEGDLTEKQEALNRKQDALRADQDALQPEWDDLQRQQEDLWKDQAENEKAQDRIDEEEEPLRKRSEELQEDYAGELEELAKTPSSELEKDTGWLRGHREWGDDPDTPPPPVPNSLVRESPDGRTEVSYKLDENGEIALDKNGQPLETTTTITNKNGLTYSETYRSLPRDGDSVTTTTASDGSVTKIYVDSDPEDHRTPGTSVRYVTDGKGAALEMWQKQPDGEWERSWSRHASPTGEGEQEAANGVGRPPAYLTVEKPLVDGGGHPADDSFSPPMVIELEDGRTRTDYMRQDGSELRVVTTDTTRYVADESNEIQEVWYKNRNGAWYLKDSITQLTRYGDEPPLGTLGEGWR